MSNSNEFERAAGKVLEPPREPVASKAELERLEGERATPKAEKTLTPGGRTEKAVHTEINKQRERRIRKVRKQLRRRKGKSREDFDRSR